MNPFLQFIAVVLLLAASGLAIWLCAAHDDRPGGDE